MANFVFNRVKGEVKTLVATVDGSGNEALILVPLETSGLESDATLIDKDTLADVLSGATNEQTTAGRKTITTATSTVDDANDRWAGDFADQTYSGANALGNAVSAWLVCYDPDTAAGTDANIIPLTKADLAWTPDGNSFTLQVADFIRAT